MKLNRSDSSLAFIGSTPTPLTGLALRNRIFHKCKRDCWQRQSGIDRKRTKSGVEEGKGGGSPSRLIDARIKEPSDWRGQMLARTSTRTTGSTKLNSPLGAAKR